MNRQRIFCALFFLLFFIPVISVSAAGKTVQPSVVQSVTFCMGSAYEKGVEAGTTPLSAVYALSVPVFSGYAGMQTTDVVFDLTAGAAWWPLRFHPFTSELKFGVAGVYHFQNYTGISTEHDILGGLALRFQTAKKCSVSFAVSYAEKITTVFAVQDYVPYFHDHGMAVLFSFDKVWKNGFEVYYEGGSYDLFRYPLFCSPSGTYGIAINTRQHLRFAAETEIRWSDLFTVAANIDSLIFRGSLRYTF
jgi:hypothetical protein